MRRMAFAVIVLLSWSVGSVRADSLPLITEVPGTYTPGQMFTFQVSVPSLLDLSSYHLELLFNTNVTAPNLLAFPTVAPNGKYVFPSNGGFSYQFTADPNATSALLALDDSTSPPVNAVPGVNNAIAAISVRPGADLTGPITISVGDGTSFTYNRELRAGPPPGPITVQQAPSGSGGNPVPAPPAALLFALGAGLLATRRGLRRREA